MILIKTLQCQAGGVVPRNLGYQRWVPVRPRVIGWVFIRARTRQTFSFAKEEQFSARTKGFAFIMRPGGGGQRIVM